MQVSNALICATLIVGSATVANAQTLPHLNVTNFTFASDTSTPAQEQPFHLIIDVHVNGRVDELEGVVLPQLGTLEILGDEKHTTVHGDSTEYRESIAVVAHRGGTISIPPAYLDAIDARDGKPKRFLSDPLVLTVADLATVVASPAVFAWLARVAGFALGGLIVVALAFAALRMRHAPELVVPTPKLEPASVSIAPTPAQPVDAVVEARQYLERDPSRESALAARSALWCSVGAGDGETLADVVRRPAAHDPVLRAALRALERAAFTDDDDRPAAVEDALRALDGYRA